MPRARREWDHGTARVLYDEGRSATEIAATVGTSVYAVCSYAQRHWPKREVAIVIREWDRDRALSLYNEGLSFRDIAKVLGVGHKTLSSHAMRAGWPPRLPPPAPDPGPQPWPAGVPTLPPLPSLTFGD